MSKGSRQRKTAQTFWDNWDRIFGDEYEANKHVSPWHCERCGSLSDDDVMITEINHLEPMGDRSVSRVELDAQCGRCGRDVEFNN